MASSAAGGALPVLVLGAGLTGLSAARTLGARGTAYRVLEKGDRPGGHAVTLEDEGFRFDRTGHLLHLRDAELRKEVLELCRGDCREITRRSVVWSNGVYTRYPFQANTFGLPPDVAYECVMGFLEAHYAVDKPEPRSFLDYCHLHFGKGITRHFMRPYNEKLWGVSLSEITSAWCQRFVPLPALKDVIGGALGVRGPELGYNQTFLYPRLGIGELPDAMARSVGPLDLGRAPRRIDLRARVAELDGENVPFDVLLSTVPLSTLLALLDPLPDAVRDAAKKLRATHLYYLDVALEREPAPDFHWAYVPEAKYPFYRVGAYTRFSPELAPPGTGSLYVELAGRSEPDLDALWPDVLAGLTEMGIVRSQADVRFARLRRLDCAYVVFDHDYYPALAVIEPFLAQERVISTGRYGAWTYSSMEDALLMGRNGAELALRYLGGGG
jgi:protoporphyrinogen oxidase